MIPAANLMGFAGQALARKLSKVIGLILETTLASVIEVILVMVLLKKNEFEVIKAALLGSILANLLLCLGACFFAGGIRREMSSFDENISEVGSGLMLVAGLGLLVPTAFSTALNGIVPSETLQLDVLKISRHTAILLLIAFLM